MNGRGPARLPRTTRAFTLIEMIGVLAIMALLSAVLVPNALRSLDRAAVNAEVQTLHNVGAQIKLYLRDKGTVPTLGGWTVELSGYTDLSALDLSKNKRGIARVYLTDPATAPTQRVIILSCLWNGLALPTPGNINTAVRFQDIWQAADGSLPTAVSWAGWTAWNAVANSGEFLVIERVNLLPVYNTDLQTINVTLNNKTPPPPGVGGIDASYSLVLANGTIVAPVKLAAGASVTLPQRPRDQINLYRAISGANLDSSYVLSVNNTSNQTYDFNGTTWTPK
jgi:prepilin-type N-terminal cleavage/methylation domain-containing protein